jgi:endonuclease-3
MRETIAIKTTRLKKIIAGFQRTYPDAHCDLTYANPLQLLVAVILSAQCTDKRVNLITPELFKKYRSAKDFADAPRAELEQFIKSAGFFPQQGEEHPELLPQTRRASRRRSAAHDGGIARA